MTDPLSTIRQALNTRIGCDADWIPKPGSEFFVREWTHRDDCGRCAALAACDALEAERLTPEEARELRIKQLKYRFALSGPLLAKLERRAGD